MSEQFFIQEFPNGLTLLGEKMDLVSSAAFCLALPAGSAADFDGGEGGASIVSEWLFRGAGDRDTRSLNDALDNLGCQHDESVRSEHLVLTAAQLGRNLGAVLEIYADILRRPRLEDKSFDACRALAIQDLASLEDEPARKARLLVREKFYPQPLGRSAMGTEQSLAAMTADGLRDWVSQTFHPQGMILAVAGCFEWDALCRQVDRLLGDWPGRARAAQSPRGQARSVSHLPKESAQSHICLAHATVPVNHPQHYAARMGETVLSGGMSSRLFTEVREKRGLVYHVSSHYHSLKGCAGMFTYAGTPPERTQQTFDVTVGELRRLSAGIEPHEMARARVQLRSGLVMQAESTSSRASGLASDWYHLGRLRSLGEISDAIGKVTAEDVLEHLAQWPARDFTLVVLGPQPVDTSAISGK